MSTISGVACALASLLVAASGLQGQSERGPIEDNSFLIEEAYNQERGVVQHINTFARSGDAWVYAFTQEWPVFSQRHQFSYTVPVLNGEPGSGEGAGFGDVALNYRLQLGGGESALAVAPRVSLVLPTGDYREGRGAGGAGFQANLPVSLALSEAFVAHTNAGFGYTPSLRTALASGEESIITLGQSVIWLLQPSLNLMLEGLWTRSSLSLDDQPTSRSTSFLLSPGIRGAIDFASGLQVVPGAAVAFDLTSDGEDPMFFLYLSLEHGVAALR